MSRWLIGHQWIDLAGAIAVGAVLWRISDDLSPWFLEAVGRRAAFQTIAGLSATLLGLTMATISVLASNIDKPIGGSPKGLPSKLVMGISKPMFGLIRVLGFTVAVALILLFVDTTSAKGAVWATPILASSAVVIACRLTRVLVLLSNLLKARTTG